MNKFIVACLLLTLNAFGGLPPTTLKGQGGSSVTTFGFQVPLNQATQVSGVNSLIETGNKNILQNPGFEGTGDWTASGGATSAINTTAVGTGLNGYDWNSNGASQTLTSDAVTIPNGLLGRNGVLSCAIKTPSGSATHTIGAYDGSTLFASQTITSATTFARTSLNFVFPSSGTVALRITSVAADEPEIYVDDCYLGISDGFNTSQVNQAQLLGGMSQAGASNCAYTQNTSVGENTYVDLGTAGSCASSWTSYGSVTAPAATSHQPTISNMPPGEYEVTVLGAFRSNSASVRCNFKISDGTTTFGYLQVFGDSDTIGGNLIGRISYTSAASRTFKIVAADDGTTTCSVENSIAGRSFEWIFKRFPSASEIAYRPEINAAYYSGYHDNTCSWARTNSAYGDPTADASCALTTRYSSGISAATSGSVLPALALTLPRTGTYYICALGKISASTAIGTITDIKMWDGTTTIKESRVTTGSANIPAPFEACGLYTASSLTPTISLQTKQDSGGSITINTGATNASAIEWTVFPITGNMPAPVLVDRESVVYQDQKASGTAGGTCTSGSYVTRTINTLSNPSGATWAGSPSSNQFTLTSGSYRVNGYATGSSVGLHKAKLYNVTDASDAIIGTSEQTVTASVDTGASKIQGVITITGTKTFEVRHRCSTTNADDGFGVATSYSDVEVYTSLEIEKFR